MQKIILSKYHASQPIHEVSKINPNLQKENLIFLLPHPLITIIHTIKEEKDGKLILVFPIIIQLVEPKEEKEEVTSNKIDGKSTKKKLGF